MNKIIFSGNSHEDGPAHRTYKRHKNIENYQQENGIWS
jgi:hypothetical protein